METKTIILDGIEYELKPIQPKPQSEPTLPTLQEVFNKLKPVFYVNSDNGIMYASTAYGMYSEDCQNTLSTERQCKRIQALIALQNIADYYNGEVDYRGKGFVVGRHDDFNSYSVVEIYMDLVTPCFKSYEHANLAIEILRNAQLLNNL